MKFITLFSLILITACAQIPIGTRSALADLDVMTTDVTKMRFATVRAADMPIRTSATLTMSLETPERTVSGTYILSQISEPVPEAEQIRTIFAIADVDHDRFNAMRSEMLALRDQHPDSSGSVSINASGCLTGPIPEGPMLVSVFIGMEGRADWLPILRNVDIATLGPQSDGEALQNCAN